MSVFKKPSKRRVILTVILALAIAGSAMAQKKPNILVIFGDDIGQTNISAYSFGVLGYKTPNLDKLAHEGLMFTDYYAENSCTAGRSTFITGRLVNDSKVSETDESSYEQSTKFTPRDNDLKYKPGPQVRVFKLHNNPKKKYRYKNI